MPTFDRLVGTNINGDLPDVVNASLNARFGMRVSVLNYGAVADGTTDDRAAVYSAIAAAGAEGTVYFPASPGASETIYYFAASRPNFSGSQIACDPGVILAFEEVHPDINTWNFVTPVTIRSDFHSRTKTHPTRQVINPEAWVAPGGIEDATFTKSDLTTWTGFAAQTSSGTFTRYTGEGTATANAVTWPATTTRSILGVERAVEVGIYHEATLLESSAQGHYLGLYFINAANRWAWFRTLEGAGAVTVVDGGQGVLATPPTGTEFTLPNGIAYKTTNVVRVGFIFDDARTARVYINELFVSTLTFNSDITMIAFGAGIATSWSSLTIKDCIRSADWSPPVVAPLSVATVGDSITAGAWETVAWPDLLPAALAPLDGGGLATISQNLAVSGKSTSWFAPGGSGDLANEDFSGDDYVLVMLGTNNVQSATSGATFETDLVAIAAEIISQGAVPIFGIFPTFTSQGVTGTGVGVATTNYHIAAEKRGRLMRVCAENGWEVATVNAWLGANIDLYLDNIHADYRGAALIARAFAQAVARHRRRRAA